MAKLRIGQWANVLRAMYMRGAPNANCYTEQGFINGRIDPDQLRRYIEQDERFDAAVETDEWLMVLRDVAPAAYEAVYIKYVQREPGTSGMLDGETQRRLWTKQTGLRKSQYYAKLLEAERFIGFQLGLKF